MQHSDCNGQSDSRDVISDNCHYSQTYWEPENCSLNNIIA